MSGGQPSLLDWPSRKNVVNKTPCLVEYFTVDDLPYLDLVKSKIRNSQTNCLYPINLMAGICKETTLSNLPVMSF